MELLCPHCQQRLQIADQHAGQMMKCPLCNKNFTAPQLPAREGAGSYPLESPPPPKPPQQPPPQQPPKPPQQPSLPPQRHAEAADFAADFSVGRPDKTDAERAAEIPGGSRPGQAWQTYEPAQRAAEPYHKRGFAFRVSVLRWVPAGALFLVFILSFFTWVYWGYGSATVLWQGGWGAGFNSLGSDPDLVGNTALGMELDKNGRVPGPGMSGWVATYLLLLTFLVLPLAVAIPVYETFRIKVPPAVHSILAFRWMILGVLVLITFLFLSVQMIVGFSLENQVHSELPDTSGNAAQTTEARKSQELMRGMTLAGLHRGSALQFTFILHALAVVAAGYMLWMETRRTAAEPRLELQW